MVSTSRCSVISFTALVIGTATSIPDCNTGAVIIKITSSTSTTSTRGVMLISASDDRVAPELEVNATLSGLPESVPVPVAALSAPRGHGPLQAKSADPGQN